MATPTPKETARQYRVTQQMVAMHAALRDRYARTGLTTQVALLVFAALVSCTTFAGHDFYEALHVAPDVGRLALGVASAVAFAGSLVLLLLDPRGRSAMHREAAARWSDLVLKYRRSRDQGGNWPPDSAAELADAYAAVCEITVPIPDAKFNRLKSRYLRKVEISRLKDRYPGCPIFVLAFFCRVRDTHGAYKAFKTNAKPEPGQPSTPEDDQRDPPGGGLSDGP